MRPAHCSFLSTILKRMVATPAPNVAWCKKGLSAAEAVFVLEQYYKKGIGVPPSSFVTSVATLTLNVSVVQVGFK